MSIEHTILTQPMLPGTELVPQLYGPERQPIGGDAFEDIVRHMGEKALFTIDTHDEDEFTRPETD